MEGQAPVRMIMDPAVVAGYVGRVDPALRLDEPRARAVARLLDELRRLARAAASTRGDVAA